MDKIDEFLTDFNLLGYTLINNYLDNHKLNKILELIKNIRLTNDEYDERTKCETITNIYGYNKYFLDILENDLFYNLMKDILDDPYKEPNNFNILQYNARSNGKKNLNVHIDSIVPYLGDKCFTVNIIIYLEDSNENTGCTLVVPGSHKTGKYTIRDYKKMTPVNAKKGDILIFDSRLWHAAKAASVDKSRWALVLTIGQWWIKPRYDIINCIPEKIKNKLSEKQLKLLGFNSIPIKFDLNYNV